MKMLPEGTRHNATGVFSVIVIIKTSCEQLSLNQETALHSLENGMVSKYIGILPAPLSKTTKEKNTKTINARDEVRKELRSIRGKLDGISQQIQGE